MSGVSRTARRAICGAGLALVMLSQAISLHAQQSAGGAAQTSVQGQTVPLANLAAASPSTQAPGNSPAAQSPSATISVEAPAPVDDAARTNAGVGPLRELSPWSMFLSADILVKAVIIGLVLASLATWTIFIAKTVQLSRAQKQLRGALMRIADARSLNEAQLALASTASVLSALLSAATQEIRISAENGGESENGIKERVASRFSDIVRLEARAIRHGMALVATIGATAPFVGLFGTVWGIMNSFIGISKAQTTNLAVVAPGIAEALLATAVGLGAAIPAVIIYNHFSRATKGYLDVVARGSGAVGRLVSRDLDRFNARTVSRAAE